MDYFRHFLLSVDYGKFLIVGLFIGVIIYFGLVFEKNSVYYPEKKISYTPSILDLDFEDIYFRTQDKIVLNGWFVPNNRARATILYCHGNAGNISHRIEMIKLLHDLGFNVFIYDYRGYGNSAGSMFEKGTYLDVEAAYNYLIDSRRINPDEIIVYGRSLGGAVAINLALHQEVKALIIDSAFTSISAMVSRLYPVLSFLRNVTTIKYDNLSKISNIKVSKLIIHSEEDEMIPVSDGQKLFEKAVNPKRMMRTRGSHNEGYLLYKDKFIAGLEQFFLEIGVEK